MQGWKNCCSSSRFQGEERYYFKVNKSRQHQPVKRRNNGKGYTPDTDVLDIGYPVWPDILYLSNIRFNSHSRYIRKSTIIQILDLEIERISAAGVPLIMMNRAFAMNA